MKKIIFLVMIIIMALRVPADAQNPDSKLLMDMVKFDQVYIPVLVYTNEDIQDSSQIAMKYLLQAWDKFKADNENPPNWFDSLWDADIKAINHLIDESDTLIAKDSNLNEAHLKLEDVRTVFINMRERNDIEYYPDNLITFHALLEAILNIVQNTKSAEFTQEQIEGISIILPQATSTWQNLEKSKFDPALYGFSSQKVKTLNQLVAQEQASLNALQNALDSGDNTAIIKAAKAVKPAFVQIYMLFGDFNFKNK